MKRLFYLLLLSVFTTRQCAAQEEPFGKIKIKTGHGRETLDYDFTLSYFDTVCGINSYVVPGIRPFENNDTIGYKAPTISNYRKFFDLFTTNIHYPKYARENDIQGRVWIFIAISKEGVVERLSVKKGVHVTIDKEAVRVLRLMKIEQPALLHGEPTDVCLTLPMNFRIE